MNSASRRGLDREEVSPEGISSSVVVTGSWSTAASSTSRFSARGCIFGQSVMLGPITSSTLGSALPKP